MYKALDIRDNTEIVILDPRWLGDMDKLRQFDRKDLLVCQGCKQPVRVRAGEQRREHFAHKHLENCSYADESVVLHNARAVLYEWLVSKFGAKVIIEKEANGIELLRPIDCWVQQGAKVFAYWIFDSTLKSEKRMILRAAEANLGVHFNWVFAHEMLRTQRNNLDNLILSTTEREFIRHSSYEIPSQGYFANGSLQYLDAENRKLTTFRCLTLYHQPQIYKGISQTNDLGSILVDPQNGEFVHEGEHERRQKHQQEQEIIKHSQQNTAERYSLHRKPASTTYQNPKYPLPPEPSKPKVGTCIFCGKVTDDWWWHDGKTGQCKCKSCLQQGRA